jgi:proteasome lid subunit RPN8/RPN11
MTGFCRPETVDYLIIPRQIFVEMLNHCKGDYPNEACGILAGKGKATSRLYKMANTEKSPVSYSMDPTEQFKVMKDMRTNDLSMVAIFHSHPSSPAYPSDKDVGLAFYEDSAYIIVSLMEREAIVKAFSIRERDIKEIGICVEEDFS